MKKIFYILIALCIPMAAMAESRELRDVHPHEIRIAYGDPMFETTAFYASMHRDYTYLSPNHVYTELQHYRYTGHVMAEYQYRVNSWFGAGAQVDFSEFFWDKVQYVGGSNDPILVDPQNCYNIVVMPTARFTWVHHYYFDMYTEFGLGLIVNGGTEMNKKGHNVDAGFAADVALIGCTVGNNHLFGGLELGGLYGMRSLNTLYLVNSRIFTASFGVRF